MSFLSVILLYLLAASILLAFIYTLKSLRLQNRFKWLGSSRSRSVDEIVKFAGKPSHRGRLDADREVLEWRRVGFHIALLFTDGSARAWRRCRRWTPGIASPGRWRARAAGSSRGDRHGAMDAGSSPA